jgi:hypothetical protein
MTTKQRGKSKAEQDRELSSELAMTFPASDPPSSSEPGGGITGPDAKPSARESSKPAKKRK